MRWVIPPSPLLFPIYRIIIDIMYYSTNNDILRSFTMEWSLMARLIFFVCSSVNHLDWRDNYLWCNFQIERQIERGWIRAHLGMCTTTKIRQSFAH